MPRAHEIGITVGPAATAAELRRVGVRRNLHLWRVVSVLAARGGVSGMRGLMVRTRVLGGVTNVTGSSHGSGFKEQACVREHDRESDRYPTDGDNAHA